LKVFVGDTDDNNQLVVIASDKDGDALSYQWQKYVDDVWINIDGANSSNYIPDKSKLGTIDYKVIVSDVESSVTSDIATVTVNSNPPVKIFDINGNRGWGLLWYQEKYYCGNQPYSDGPNITKYSSEGTFESLFVSGGNLEFTSGFELYENNLVALAQSDNDASYYIATYDFATGELISSINFQNTLNNFIADAGLDDLYPQDIAFQNGQWYMSANKDGNYSCLLLLDIDFNSGDISVISEKKPGGGAENGLHYTGLASDGTNIWLNGGSEILKLDENCNVIKSYPEPMDNFNIYGIDYDTSMDELICYSKGHVENISPQDIVETVYRWKPE